MNANVIGNPVRRPSAQRDRCRRADAGTIGFVSTYPPTKCGLATFTASLARALAGSRRSGAVGVVSCVDEPGLIAYPPEVVGEWTRGSSVSLEAAATVLDTFDSVVVQHEFGLFGGDDGTEILDLLSRLRTRAIVVLHTVCACPSRDQRTIVEQLARSAHRLVAQSAVARKRLLDLHTIDPACVAVVQHGARRNIGPRTHRPTESRSRPTILTWGLLGPGKGIEFAIDAIALLRDLDPRYVVLGETHPNVVRQFGETYRESLHARARALAVEDCVEFKNGYRDTASILAEIREADVVLLPYLSRDQVVSGVLVEAIASGKPVVATAFPHAIELLGEGSGLIVPHEDAAAIADALRVFLTDHELAAQAAAIARRQAALLTWENVARSYLRLTKEAQHATVYISR